MPVPLSTSASQPVPCQHTSQYHVNPHRPPAKGHINPHQPKAQYPYQPKPPPVSSLPSPVGCQKVLEMKPSIALQSLSPFPATNHPEMLRTSHLSAECDAMLSHMQTPDSDFQTPPHPNYPCSHPLRPVGSSLGHQSVLGPSEAPADLKNRPRDLEWNLPSASSCSSSAIFSATSGGSCKPTVAMSLLHTPASSSGCILYLDFST